MTGEFSVPKRLARVVHSVMCFPMKVEVEQEEDGRWIAEVPGIPGAMGYGSTQPEAVAKVEVLVLRILADRIEQGEPVPQIDDVFSIAV